MDSIRVLVANDHRFYREGIRSVLSGVEGIEVVGEAATGTETIEQAEQLQPDVVLMDLKTPGLDGIEATRRILHTSPHIGILVVTMYDDDGQGGWFRQRRRRITGTKEEPPRGTESGPRDGFL